MNNIIVAFFGHIDQENMDNFWRKYLDLQYSLHENVNVTFVGHNNTSVLNDLLKRSYGISASNFKDSAPEITKEKSLALFSNDEIIHESIQNVLSLEESLSLVSQLGLDKNTSVLLTRWTSTKIDNDWTPKVLNLESLPLNYIYMNYVDEVDIGYSDEWIYASNENLKKLHSFKEYFIESITGKQPKLFSNWPLIEVSFRNKLNAFKKNLCGFFYELIDFDRLYELLPLFKKKIYSIEYRLNKIVEMPPIRGENKLSLDFDTGINIDLEPKNIKKGALLKSYFIETSLRSKLRFLDTQDFEKSSAGKVINPISYCVIINHNNEPAEILNLFIEQAKKLLTEQCDKIIVISNSSHIFRNTDECENNNLVFIKSESYKHDITAVLDVCSSQSIKPDFLYVMDLEQPLLGVVDNIYLNSVLSYMKHFDEKYLLLNNKFSDADFISEVDFPGIHKVNNSPCLSLGTCIIQTNKNKNHIRNNRQDVGDSHYLKLKLDLDVDNDLGHTNSYFPHAKRIPLSSNSNNQTWADCIVQASNKLSKYKNSRNKVW